MDISSQFMKVKTLNFIVKFAKNTSQDSKTWIIMSGTPMKGKNPMHVTFVKKHLAQGLKSMGTFLEFMKRRNKNEEDVKLRLGMHYSVLPYDFF